MLLLLRTPSAALPSEWQLLVMLHVHNLKDLQLIMLTRLYIDAAGMFPTNNFLFKVGPVACEWYSLNQVKPLPKTPTYAGYCVCMWVRQEAVYIGPYI